MRKFEIVLRVFAKGEKEKNIKIIIPSVSSEEAEETLLVEYRKNYYGVTHVSTTEIIEL